MQAGWGHTREEFYTAGEEPAETMSHVAEPMNVGKSDSWVGLEQRQSWIELHVSTDAWHTRGHAFRKQQTNNVNTSKHGLS